MSAHWSDPTFAIKNWGNRRGRPWSQADIDLAVAMRFRGAADEEIADELKRSVGSVASKIGYRRVG